jgi:two-component system response regulator YesN
VILEGFRKLFNWEMHGCEVVGDAMDGVGAIHQADALLPQLVVMDLNLPVINGMDAIRTIRERHPETQFIIVTGYDDFDHCRNALRLNVVDYILKPVDFTEFGVVVDRVRGRLKDTAATHPCKKSAGDSQVVRILAWLNDHMQEDICLARITNEFHLNSSYISQLFKQELNVNYSTYLKQIRVNQAKVYLCSTDLSITEISTLSGFRDYRLMAQAFKELEGELPSKYRKRRRPINTEKGGCLPC